MAAMGISLLIALLSLYLTIEERYEITLIQRRRA